MADLCTLAEVKAFIPISGTTDDAALQAVITRSSAQIERHFSRKFYVSGAGADTNPITEIVNGAGTPYVRASRIPLTALTSVHESTDQTWDATTLIAASDYVVDLERGIVRLKGGVFGSGFRNVRLIYSQTTTVPDDVKDLAVEIVARIWKSKDMIHLRSSGMGEGSANDRIVGRITSEICRDFGHLYRYGAVLGAGPGV